MRDRMRVFLVIYGGDDVSVLTAAQLQETGLTKIQNVAHFVQNSQPGDMFLDYHRLAILCCLVFDGRGFLNTFE